MIIQVDKMPKSAFTAIQRATQTTQKYNSGQNAFTLAEVLITLGIIGIVAAMTLPALITKYQEKVLKTQSKKSYALLSNALMSAKANNSYDNLGELFGPDNTPDQIIDVLSKEIQMVKICKAGKGGCWTWRTKASKKKYSNGVTVDGGYNTTASAVLKDGSVIFIDRYTHNGDCKSNYTSTKQDEKGYTIKDAAGNPVTYDWSDTRCGSIKVDINGAKGPNQFGADTYDFDVTMNGLGTQYYPNFFKDKLDYERYNVGEDY